MHNGVPRLLLEVRPIERHKLLELGEVEQALDQIHLLAADHEPAFETLEHPVRDRTGQLDADDVAETPPPQLVLDRFE